MKTLMVCMALAALALMPAVAQAELDRNSSDVVTAPGTLETGTGEFVTQGSWNVYEGFQISLLPEESSPPNAQYNFNHYDPDTLYDWEHYNFADFDYYRLEIDTGGNIGASEYSHGLTGDLVEWALYYYEDDEHKQTIVGGIVEDPAIDDEFTFTAYLRLVPACTYHTWDGDGEGFPNTVEIWNGEGMPTDLIGYSITAAGWMSGTEWQSSGMINLQADVLPEPATMTLLGLGLVGLIARKRRAG